MNSYHVTFYYLATGMEGVPDVRDYGIIQAASEDAAKLIVVNQHFGKESQSTKDFVRSCLMAKLQ